MNRHVMRDAVIVVSADAVRHVAPHPIDAGLRFAAVIDQIAEAQADVAALADRLQRRPIGVEVGNQHDAHGVVLGPASAPG